MKLLLHTCCAPCSVYCLKKLREEGIEPTLFWYNPNIHPFEEYKARRDCLKSYAKEKNVELVLEDEYGLDEFLCNVLKDAGERDFTEIMLNRCKEYCYPKRLRKVYQYAKENGFDTVSTTLLYSIYQKHELLRDLCEFYAKEFGINFLYRDFREGWAEGQAEAREAGLYMQKYCGCVFSEEESRIGREKSRELKRDGIKPTNENVRKKIGKTGA